MLERSIKGVLGRTGALNRHAFCVKARLGERRDAIFECLIPPSYTKLQQTLRRLSCHGRNCSQPYFFKRNQSSDNRSHGFGAKFLLKKLSASDFNYERKSAFSLKFRSYTILSENTCRTVKMWCNCHRIDI